MTLPSLTPTERMPLDIAIRSTPLMGWLCDLWEENAANSFRFQLFYPSYTTIDYPCHDHILPVAEGQA